MDIIERLRKAIYHDNYGNLPADAADEIERLRADVVRLQSTIRWALGCDEGTPDFSDDHGPGAFSWRKELMRRAALRGEE